MRALAALLLLAATPAYAQEAPARDGQHDFDFELGTWDTELRRLRNPLSGITEWDEYTGTTVVRAVWGGRANLVEFDVEGPAGRITLLSLRLYDPETRTWSLHAASARSGSLFPPVVGSFADGVGEFYGDDEHDGRPVRVRFTITPAGEDVYRFEQAYSADGGETWETNWIVTDRRRP